MLDTLDLDQLAAVTGGRVNNDGADPALIDSVTGLVTKVQQVGADVLQAQQQQSAQMLQLFVQLHNGGAGGAQPAAAPAAPSSGDSPLGGLLG